MAGFWQGLYRRGGDAFTLPAANENLTAAWPHVAAAVARPGRRANVLVPLCGRTHDLAWLASRCAAGERGGERGGVVVGVEAAGEALRLWGSDHGGLDLVAEEGDDLTVYRALRWPNLYLVHSDIFAVTTATFGGVGFDMVWDRGGASVMATTRRRQFAH